MCLGVPGQVTQVDGLTADVDFWGVEKEVRLDTVDEPVEPGDYILNHVGFAIRRIPESEIDETLTLYESMMGGGPDDMLREDLIDEVEAAGSTPSTSGAPPGDDEAEPADAEDAEDLLEELDIDV
ncbi:HypC/HybG/HupF family hydrogenase formation chaperone [Haloplanus rallus]|jgi:hydrogenase expression/formation protein HypC|uniref:HypC/HybG/HupF family hydrogenase formation chaperone n=1 Tax=Haloplanus rallus TaxID=1816183 RepID=A0A6B9F3S9_9EURY|nr:HypC/HybG/HupF family hydrogenase formation chaperone [Haloplanus rallus]QGX93962.1 HypC/HybG/HupF family hydrogenase formation chaperone [Haloplanus rallus]